VALDPFARGGIEACVIRGGASAQRAGEVFSGFAGWCVDDGRAIGFLFEEVCGELVAAGLGEFDDFDGEVVTTKAMDEKVGFGELELGDDVFLDGGCGGGGEGDNGGGTKGR